jgi:hypothetical protein
MKLYRCDLNPTDPRFCFVSHHMSPFDGPMAEGTPLAPVMKRKNVSQIRLDLDRDAGGVVLPDLVANRLNYLVVKRAVASIIEDRFALGPHEVAPVVLVDGARTHSDDYAVINPHGQVDCLDVTRSELDGDSDQVFVRIFGSWAVNPAAIPSDRDIFRIRGLASGYIFTERLVDLIRAQRFTNFEFADVTV